MDKIKSILYFMKGAFLFVKGTLVDALWIIRNPRERLKQIYGVSFLRNAIYLTVNSGINLALGFVFWIVIARVYPVSEVGYGSTLISVMALLAYIGTLGFGFGIIRFLPASVDKAGLLNSSFTITTLAAVIVSLIFLAGISWWSPKLTFVQQNPVFFTAFVIFIIAATLHSVAQQTFVAFRRTSFALIQGIIFCVLRLALAVVLAYFFRIFGIFSSQGVAYVVSLGICVLVFLPQILPRYRPFLSLRRRAGSKIITFSLGNYIGEGLWSLPSWIVPIMILNVLGAEANAYFYMAWAMASLLLAISLGASFSLFAEGSYEDQSISRNLKSSLKLIVLLLVPAVVILALLGDKLLLAFGSEYSVEGTQLLRLLALAAIPASSNLLYLSIARVEKRLKSLLLVSGATAFVTLALSYILLSHLGILGIGVSWLATHTTVALFTAPKVIQKLKHPDS